MKAADIARAVAYPAGNATVFTALITFYLVLQLIVHILSLGPFFVVSAAIIAAFTLPALSLYLVSLLEARARGRNPDPPGVEHLHWYGSSWSLLQVIYYVGLGYAIWRLAGIGGTTAVVAIILVVSALLPASLAILAVTHSAVESLHPQTIGRIIMRTGLPYWLAPAFALVASWLAWALWNSSLPRWLVEFVLLYLLFAFYALTGSVVQAQKLHEKVDIHEPLGPDEAQITAGLVAVRKDVLNHAYGFVSRGNRNGGLRHIADAMQDDPEPGSAWPWYFDQMLLWEDRMPALFFGQQYLSRLLHDGEFHAAVKLIMRCRYENESFMPLPADLDQAVAAAEHVGNENLAQALRTRMP